MSTPYRYMRPDRRIRKIMADAQQLINDIEWWNANRTEHPPFDCEREKVMVSLCKRFLVAWKAGDRATWNRITDELVDYVKATSEAAS